MTGFHPSGNDRPLKGKRGVQSWACEEEPGERGGISQAPASGPLLGTCPLGGAGAELDSTSSGRRHFNSLCTLSPREAKSWLRKGGSQSISPNPGLSGAKGWDAARSSQTLLFPFPFPPHYFMEERLLALPVCPGQPTLTRRRIILNSGNAN